MKRTIEKLKHRRYRHPSGPPSPRWLAYALVTINLILIAFFLLDAPVGSYAAHTPNVLLPIGKAITDFGTSGWILFAAALLFFEALAVIRLAPGLKARFQAMLVSHVAAYIFVAVAGSGLLVNLVKRIIGRARPVLYEQWSFYGLSPFSGSRFESFPSGHATTVGRVPDGAGAARSALPPVLADHELLARFFARHCRGALSERRDCRSFLRRLVLGHHGDRLFPLRATLPAGA
jgi:hypothetical protein